MQTKGSGEAGPHRVRKNAECVIHHGARSGPCAVFRGGPEVRVRVERCCGLRVAQGALYGNYVSPGSDQTGSVEMPQVMEFHVL